MKEECLFWKFAFLTWACTLRIAIIICVDLAPVKIKTELYGLYCMLYLCYMLYFIVDIWKYLYGYENKIMWIVHP